MLSNITSFNKFKRLEITKYLLSHHSGIEVEINNRRNYGKFTNIWKLNTL